MRLKHLVDDVLALTQRKRARYPTGVPILSGRDLSGRKGWTLNPERLTNPVVGSNPTARTIFHGINIQFSSCNFLKYTYYASMKLVKPFSSFIAKGSLKELWSLALRDPGYWVCWVITIVIFIVGTK